MKAKISILIIIFTVLSSVSTAQFGKNKVQYKEFKWNYLQSTHFDIYYSQGGYDIAQFTAFVAESSLASLSNNLDYYINNRIPIIVFGSHNDFQQNNVIDEYLPEGVGGVTELFKNRILVPFEGNYEQFRHVIHHELYHGFLNDMFYGGSIQNIISKNITLNIPLWFNEGMAEVQSLNGLDKETDMFIRDAVINNYLPPIEYCGGYLAYRGGQSFFAFLNDTYGEYKLGELMNNIRGLNDVDMAFKETYKLSIEKLSEKWHKELKRIYWPEVATREDVRDYAKILTDHTEDGGFYNVAPVISPKGDKFAFISNRDDFFDVFIADVNTGQIIDKLIEGNTTSNFEELQVLTPGLSWSPDGRKIAISVKAGDRDAIFVIDVKSGDETKLPVSLNSISYVNWSPDKDKLALVGTSNKQSDIYVYDLKRRKLKNLTNDIFSDFNPTWTPDGNSILFTSDRGDYITADNVPEDFKIWNYDNTGRDVYRVNIENDKIDRITRTNNIKHGYIHYSPDGKSALYISDKNGISNIYEATWDSTGNIFERPITNSLNPIDQLSLSRDGKKLLFVSLNQGGYDIFSLDNPFDKRLPSDTIPLTWFAKKLIAQEKITENLPEDSSDKNSPDIDFSGNDSVKYNTVTENLNDSVNVKKDTSSVYGKDIKLTFRDSGKEKVKSFSEYDSSYSSNTNFKIEDNMNDDGTFKSNRYKIKFSPDLVYGNAIYSSYYGVQGIAQIALSDVLGNHRITMLTSMVIDLKNSDYAVAYQYLPKRIDYGFELYHIARFVLYDRGLGYENLYRYRTIGGNVVLSYPVTKFKRFDGGLSFMRITRENLDDPSEQMNTSYTLVPSLSYVFDNTLWGYTSPVKGTRMNLTLLASPKLGVNSYEFTSAIGDLRTYYKLADDYTFAMRLTGGASFGANPQRFYLGGMDNWINWEFENSRVPYGESIENYAFSMNVTPLRGFNFNVRNGSKFLLTNLELRFPMFRYLIFGALPLGFANIMGNIFIDAGTTWDKTDKVQLIGRDNYNNVQTKDLLMATGFGNRIVLFGFPFRFDVAWNYDLRKFSPPKYYISLGLDF